jgi:hypothetical protein
MYCTEKFKNREHITVWGRKSSVQHAMGGLCNAQHKKQFKKRKNSSFCHYLDVQKAACRINIVQYSAVPVSGGNIILKKIIKKDLMPEPKNFKGSLKIKESLRTVNFPGPYVGWGRREVRQEGWGRKEMKQEGKEVCRG